jgi:Fe2+ or Zn2+ uptake regulation protein
LDDVRLSKCSNCSAMHLRHTMCEKCGTYRGIKVIDMTAVVATKVKKDKKKEAVAK